MSGYWVAQPNAVRVGLPPGWQEFRDPRSSRSYFYNEKTGLTQWNRPVANVEPIGATPMRNRPVPQNRYSESYQMPDIGVYLIQDTVSGKLVVSQLVPGGSADRSGIIRIHDAIVKIDDEDIQGQPMSVIRDLVSGKQATFVVLAFRRMTGKEIFYYDVELERGSPEYFAALDRQNHGPGGAMWMEPNNLDSLRAWAADYKNLSKEITW